MTQIDPAWLVVVLMMMVLVALVAVWLRLRTGPMALTARLEALTRDGERVERALREEARSGREEQSQASGTLARSLGETLDRLGESQQQRMGAFAEGLRAQGERSDAQMQGLRQGLLDDARRNREESAQAQQRLTDALAERLQALGVSSDQRLGEVRGTLERQLTELRQDNAAKLEQMRATVDEKLHATLEARLDASFKQVSERLEQVYRGLGEMQTLAAGVGDLKRVLTNVKTRGTWGEVQLEALIEQMLAPEQYARNVATLPGSNDRVECAVRLPGDLETSVWLPIDAKFPKEDYERLLEAQDRADREGADAAGRALEAQIRREALRIRSKYVGPPHTTDFAIMFLPIEGLYAEVVRRPGLVDLLQREARIVVAGPTTLAALLNSLQMGFRTLAIQQRSSEVWQLLGTVKHEFGKFGVVLARARKQLESVSNSIGRAEQRTRVISKTLRSVETLPQVGAPPSVAPPGEDVPDWDRVEPDSDKD